MKDRHRRHCQRISAKFYFSWLTIISFDPWIYRPFHIMKEGYHLGGFLLAFNITVKRHGSMRLGRTCIGIFYRILTMYGTSIMCHLHTPWDSGGSVSAHSGVGIMHLYNGTRGPASIYLPAPILVLSEASPHISHLVSFNDFSRSFQMSSNPEISNPLNLVHSAEGFSKIFLLLF